MISSGRYCIFCKQVCEQSKTIEHIIPESLGNKEHVLPVGIVCDDCNNYFGAKVEKQLLEQPFFQHVRYRQNIDTKRGRSVPWKAYSLFPVQNPEKYIGKHGFSKEQLIHEMFLQGSLFYSPHIPEPPIDNLIVSRFLAKVAIEVVANICIQSKCSLEEEIIKNQGLDPLREYARYGSGKYWPYNQRKIYHENELWAESDGQHYQILHEYRTFSVIQNEYYLALAIFGFEFVINYSNRNIDSFLEWLKTNNNVSPLAFEKFPTPY